MKANTFRNLSSYLRRTPTGILLLLVTGFTSSSVRAQNQASPIEDQGAEVLTRGPVHEAFAGIVSFNPEPGFVISEAPPKAIEEFPPEQRPTGDNITWIPGYWGWDDERDTFLWISGTWRALPPDREWISGYWSTVPEGYQWISGYWADSQVEETTYLPQPPKTVEVGPNVVAPSTDHEWTPGNWVWRQERYAWRPGYWMQGRSDWDWTPAHYVWTPRGYIFVDGFWDYPVGRRGVLFAPVYFDRNTYSRPGYRYSPTIVISLGAFVEHLFLRPRYHHYYFGDYYAPRYEERGFYSPFRYSSSRYGYDPVYSHRRWEHRGDRDWQNRYEDSYRYRRDHESARPPRTWDAQRNFKPDRRDSNVKYVTMATTINQLSVSNENNIKFQNITAPERQSLTSRGQEVKKFRDNRQKLERQGRKNTEGKETATAKVKVPRSPIVGMSSAKLAKEQAPPKRQRGPDPDTKIRPKGQKLTDRPDGKKPKSSQPQPVPGKLDSEGKKMKPGRGQEPPQTKEKPKGEKAESKGKPRPKDTPGKPEADDKKMKPGRGQEPTPTKEKSKGGKAESKGKPRPQVIPGKPEADEKKKKSEDRDKKNKSESQQAAAKGKPRSKSNPDKSEADEKKKAKSEDRDKKKKRD